MGRIKIDKITTKISLDFNGIKDFVNEDCYIILNYVISKCKLEKFFMKELYYSLQTNHDMQIPTIKDIENFIISEKFIKLLLDTIKVSDFDNTKDVFLALHFLGKTTPIDFLDNKFMINNSDKTLTQVVYSC